MFSKSKINEPGPHQEPLRDQPQPPEPIEREVAEPATAAAPTAAVAAAPVPVSLESKPPASMLAADLVIEGNIKSTGDIEVEGDVEGDIRASLLTVGESATIKGEVMADEVVVNGRVVGRVRGLKVRLTSTARVEGDIVHKTIAIESGAHFEGTVARRDDPMSDAATPGSRGSNGTEMVSARVSGLAKDQGRGPA